VVRIHKSSNTICLTVVEFFVVKMATVGNGSLPQNGTVPQRKCSQSPSFDAFAIAQAVCLFLLFLSLGMTISLKDVRKSLRYPKGILLAQFGQFLILPLVGWGMAKAFALGVPAAVGLVAVTTAPGGALSNIIAILYQADIPLSVCATAVSSIVAIGMMPLNQYIYMIATNLAPGVCLNVSGIIISAVLVVAGSGVGVVLKPWLQQRKLFILIKVVFLIGTLAALAIIIMGLVENLNSKLPITALPSNLIGAAICPYVIGTVFGLVSASLLGLERPSRVSVALEIGIQNKIVAVSVLTFLFPAESLSRAASFAMPLLYAIVSLVGSIVWVGIAWKLGWTNMPREKGFIEAFRMARLRATEERHREVYGEEPNKDEQPSHEQTASSVAMHSNVSRVVADSPLGTSATPESEEPQVAGEHTTMAIV
jgi:predicted Na+-dependent transporter